MVSSEVQRTLVKSPPELWAELSDPTTLGRHLGELGEIRIVRSDPERAVEWEATAADGAQASGRVELESSGWGTKVTLSASRILPIPESEAIEPELEAEAHAPVAIEPGSEVEAPVATESAAEPEDEPSVESVTDPQPAALAKPERELEPEPEREPELPTVDEPQPRQGFFARLFRPRPRRPRPRSGQGLVEPEPEPAVAPEPEPEPPAAVEAPAPETAAPEEPVPEETAPEVDISAELAELEQKTTAVLTGVLDRLGAAHHRPFSRA